MTGFGASRFWRLSGEVLDAHFILTPSHAHAVSYGDEADVQRYLSVYIGTTDQVTLYYKAQGVASAKRSVTWATPIKDARWHILLLVVDARSASLYIDHALVEGAPKTLEGALEIGPGPFFTGLSLTHAHKRNS
jgi:hypothetical protein